MLELAVLVDRRLVKMKPMIGWQPLIRDISAVSATQPTDCISAPTEMLANSRRRGEHSQPEQPSVVYASFFMTTRPPF